jgi:hypothetical protein
MKINVFAVFGNMRSMIDVEVLRVFNHNFSINFVANLSEQELNHCLQ